MPETVALRVNGRSCDVCADPTTPLLYILRNDLQLKGARFGCGEGQCGACMVLVDGNPMQSCDVPLWSVRDRDITTIEGLAAGGDLHPVQQAFIDAQAAQCGYCTNGIIMSAVALLARARHPSDAEIAAALARNLCRCGSHVRIVRAIRAAAQGSPGRETSNSA